MDAAAARFREALKGKHAEVIGDVINILRKHFADDAGTEGYKKDGAVAVARFEIDGDGEDVREIHVIRQREASELIMRLLKGIVGL